MDGFLETNYKLNSMKSGKNATIKNFRYLEVSLYLNYVFKINLDLLTTLQWSNCMLIYT